MSLHSRAPRLPTDEVLQPAPPVSSVELTQPDLTLQLDDGYRAHGWMYRSAAATGSIKRVALLAHGWRGLPLTTLAQEMTGSDPDLLAVAVAQPRVNVPRDPRLFSRYVADMEYKQVGQRRTETILRIGAALRDTFEVPEIDLIGHSLGGVDVANAAADYGRDFAIGNMTLLASAGQLKNPKEAFDVIRRVKTAHCPNSPTRHTPRANLPQTAIEGAYALFSKIGPKLQTAREGGSEVRGIAFENDQMFPVVEGVIPDGFDTSTYMVLRGGDTCHSMLNHAAEAPRVAEAVLRFSQHAAEIR